MKKVFYSVEYVVIGRGTSRAWFDNLEAAQEFAKRDYTGKPVKHTYTSAKNIREAEELCRMWDAE